MRSLRLEVLVAVGLLLGAPTADAAAQQFSVEPVAFNIQNLRSATWWGWTTTPAEATLHFEVIVGP